MTQRFFSGPQASLWVRRLAGASILGLASVSLLGLAGCDTVARISFTERSAQAIHSADLTSPASQCGGVDGVTTLRFALIANDNTPIVQGDALASQILDLRASDFDFSDGRVFSLPDQLCESSSECPGNFVCTRASDSLGDQFRRCQAPETIVSVSGQPRFVADRTNNQLFGVLFENAGSLRGWLPPDVAQLRPVDDDGTVTGGGDTRSAFPDRATDPNRRRAGLLSGLETNWERAATYARNNGGRTTNFGFWTFAGSRAGVISRIAVNHPTEQVWTSQMNQVLQATTDYRTVDPDQTRANVYEAINTVLTDGYEDTRFDGWDKHLVVFVDGPDDLRLEQNHTADTVIARAKAAGVRLFIVHLDPSLKDEFLRDDYRYYENQSPCADDSACLNFEECRLPERYSDPGAVGVTYPTDHADNPEARYCLPARDENGRIGPVEDYSRMACETEGGYIYVPSSQGLRSRGDWLPLVLDGLWEVDLLISEADRGNLFPDQPFKLQTQMGIQLGADRRAYDFSQEGGQAGEDDDGNDSRPVFFTAP